jgi:hypothetical protein
MQKALLAVCSFFLIHFSLFCQTTELYINEFIADNTIEFQDENYEYPDWIELYNKGNSTIDLT